MATCEKIRAKRRKICVGDLTRRVQIYRRSLQPVTQSSDGQVSQGYELVAEPYAMIESRNAITTFDGITISDIEAYRIYVRFDSRIKYSDDLYVRLNGENIQIRAVENLDARNEFVALVCVNQGDETRAGAL